MGTTLTGTTPQDTYDSLIKVTDNAPLTGSLKVLTDGLGNDSALALSTGAASVTGTLAVSGNATFDTNTLFVDAAANEVGIGTATPSSPLDVVANNTTAIHLRLRGRASDSVGQMELWNNAQDTRYAYFAADSTSVGISTTQAIPLTFGTNTAERVRIASGGDVFVNKTSLSYATVGCAFEALGTVSATRASDVSAVFARNTTDGDVIQFRKDNVIKGSIGISADGISIKLGGTAAANELDDYEEGTFTPTLNFGGASVGVTYGTVAGKYTKIGNLVNFSIRMTLTSKGSSTGEVRIAGLPFTIVNTGNADFTSLSIGALQNITFVDFPMGLCIANTDYLVLEESASGGAITQLTNADFQNDSVVRVGGFYYTT